ncbi:hypothetical protein OIE68_04135 [Nocardia vinacea]|uniref:Core-binding (CB) domain-containing protein n=1 Tax=Nocardia vinacea TaxID=96468 RepID=A0ABZ1YSD9_9NOCA|nr:hypothetical protein OIE68_04135 [Nocardia vinacea]
MTSSADIHTAALLLERLGVSLDDLRDSAGPGSTVPTFAEYVPVVYAAMPATSTRDCYLGYWQRMIALWPDRRIDEPSASEFKQLLAMIQSQRQVRAQDRGGYATVHSAVSALRCLYRHAVDDNLIRPADNPVATVHKPRLRPASRRASTTTDRIIPTPSFVADARITQCYSSTRYFGGS